MTNKILLILAGASLCQSFWGVVIAGDWWGALGLTFLALVAIDIAWRESA